MDVNRVWLFGPAGTEDSNHADWYLGYRWTVNRSTDRTRAQVLTVVHTRLPDRVVWAVISGSGSL